MRCLSTIGEGFDPKRALSFLVQLFFGALASVSLRGSMLHLEFETRLVISTILINFDLWRSVLVLLNI
jgi:hypothetical protein